MDKRLIGIMRIPKSGSTSLGKTVVAAFPKARLHALPDAEMSEHGLTALDRIRRRRTLARNLARRNGCTTYAAAIRKIEAEAQEGDLVSGGHLTRAAFDMFEGHVRSIVMLRDPGQRFLSEYNYSRKGYLKKPALLRFDASPKARLAGRHDLEGFAAAMEERRDVFGDIAARFLGIRSAEEIAPRFAADVYQFGVLEDMDGFRRALGERAGVDIPAMHHNATGDRRDKEIPAAVMRRLERLYALDFEIYAWAREQLRAA